MPGAMGALIERAFPPEANIQPGVVSRSDRMQAAADGGQADIRGLALSEKEFFEALGLPYGPGTNKLVVTHRSINQGDVFERAVTVQVEPLGRTGTGFRGEVSGRIIAGGQTGQGGLQKLGKGVIRAGGKAERAACHRCLW